ncbi:hypothetical protein PRIPAC_76919 [Pristionchus pacificus]|uniref:Uncharacterized protein n=1 Tax=Pristionchus pacificus TaxID=54126 RepID=A0A454Y079_PRIPA|nr:hypothetical protein PRIPAC_76919 [Pristionchus pacificus]|eukprot:PDM70036.1 hypothetical protein PRIPAC_49248 [Pristionchus pacificus]
MKLAIIFVVLALLACMFVPSSAYNSRPRRSVDSHEEQEELFAEFREALKELANDDNLTEQQKIDKATKIAKSRIDASFI